MCELERSNINISLPETSCACAVHIGAQCIVVTSECFSLRVSIVSNWKHNKVA